VLAGCASPTPTILAGTPTQRVAASATAQSPLPSVPSPTITPGPSFELATYQDDIAGFALDYPADWIVGPSQEESRGRLTAFTSWTRPADVLPDETPPGETRMDAVVHAWDPKGDLEAFITQRQAAWQASEIAVVDEKRWSLEDGRMAASFVVEGSNGAQGYFFFTTVGDDYLALRGRGDLALLAEIAGTVR
jgi:hypothetical protein